ncbi:MAG: HesA/MoeB/ThiF family protein [Candidatus Thorarchaeota archaeon]|jgi:adenylyltransferase/sulfurtransferase
MEEESDHLVRYSRMLALRDFSTDDLEKIMETVVTVVGAGGLGSPILALLTSIGFGRIRIIDRDIVDLSNLQRQTIYKTEDIGKPKADAAADNLAMLNPNVTFEPIVATIRFDNVIELLEGSTVVIDGLDSMEARRAVNAASQKLRIPYIYGGAIEYYGNVSTFIPDETGCLHCLVGEMKDNPDATCENVGVSPSLLSLVASVEVREAVLLATKKQPHLGGRLLHVDIDTLSFESFEIGKMDSCPICGATEISFAERIKEATITMLCSESYSISPPELLSLDLDEIETRFSKEFKITRRLRSITLQNSEGIALTLISKGDAIVKGVKTKEEASSIYTDILSSI